VVGVHVKSYLDMIISNTKTRTDKWDTEFYYFLLIR